MGFSSIFAYRVVGVAAGCAALLALGVAWATAGPDTDDQGYLDSVARCAAPDAAAFFGSTETSRVAICKTPDGRYQYRGVRLRDGAKLIVPASESGGVVYVAEANGFTYTVAPSSLVISSHGQVIRREPMIDSHKPGAPPPTTTPATTTPATTTAPTTTTPVAPLPPPLPAEVGGGR